MHTLYFQDKSRRSWVNSQWFLMMIFLWFERVLDTFWCFLATLFLARERFRTFDLIAIMLFFSSSSIAHWSMRKDSTIRMTRQLSQYHVSLLSYFKNLIYSINCVFDEAWELYCIPNIIQFIYLIAHGLSHQPSNAPWHRLRPPTSTSHRRGQIHYCSEQTAVPIFASIKGHPQKWDIFFYQMSLVSASMPQLNPVLILTIYHHFGRQNIFHLLGHPETEIVSILGFLDSWLAWAEAILWVDCHSPLLPPGLSTSLPLRDPQAANPQHWRDRMGKRWYRKLASATANDL